MNHQRTTERGQALILIALAAIGLFAFSALAIDGSRSYSNKRHAQNAADTSVLAGALAAIRCTPDPCTRDQVEAAAQTAALARATSNGFTTGTDHGEIVSVEVSLCDTAVPACDGLPNGAAGAEYLRVRIVSTIPATFGRVIGRETLTTAAEAIARVNGSSAFSSFPGQAVVALSKDDCGICNSGNGNLKVYGSGVFSNSTAANCTSGNKKSSMTFWGNVKVYSDQGYKMPAAGLACIGGNGEMTWGGTAGITAGSQINPVYNIPAPSISCSRDADPVDNAAKVVHAGRYRNALDLNGSGTYTFEPGNYCFDQGIVSKVNVIANDVNFRIDGGQFEVKGDTFSCNNMTVYGAGGDGMQFNGNGSISCTKVTFYMASGGVTWNGNSQNNISARTGGPYKGLLIYVPANNGSLVRLNGNTGSQLVGSVIAPGSTISLGGNSTSSGYDSQLVGLKIDIQGSSNTIINYNPAHQYTPPQNPTIQLTK